MGGASASPVCALQEPPGGQDHSGLLEALLRHRQQVMFQKKQAAEHQTEIRKDIDYETRVQNME